MLLSPYSNYTFRVLARNKIGLSDPSAHTKTVCYEEPAVPDKNPENVIGEGDEPDNLVIFWTVSSFLAITHHVRLGKEEEAEEETER